MALSHSAAALADIYRLEGDDEVVTFTDSPNDRRYQMVQKERILRDTPGSRGRLVPGGRKPEPAVDRNSAGVSRTLPVEGVITSTTGMRNDPFNGKLTHHNGLDIAAPAGTPVKPVAPGRVIFSGWKGGYGNTVILDHGDGMVTVYAHHSSNSVSEGEQVYPDSIIALTGSTGRSTGPHLHFEAWRSGENITSDFMPGNSRVRQPSARAEAPVRRYLQSDGTLVFTNLR